MAIIALKGSDIETKASNNIFTNSKLVQIHTVAMDPSLAQGASYPFKLQTTPILSFQGNFLRSHILIYRYYHTNF